MEFGFNWTAPWPHPFFIHHQTPGFRHVAARVGKNQDFFEKIENIDLID